jgi:hypothetical protein
MKQKMNWNSKFTIKSFGNDDSPISINADWKESLYTFKVNKKLIYQYFIIVP